MVKTLDISDQVQIPLDEIELSAVRSQGAGGQNVNKLATAIHLRFAFEECAALSDEIRARLRSLDDHRVTAKGIVIKAQEHRTQAQNKQAALNRLQELVRSVLVVRKKRVPTKTPRGVRKKRIADKRHKGQVKKTRGRVGDDS